MLLHLLDGTYELFRAHFGYPSRTSPDGIEVGATLGVMETTLSLLSQSDVTHLGVAFDTEVRSFRNGLFDGYKTGEGIEPELLAQFPLVEEGLRSLGVVVWSMIEFEADDAIATAAERWKDEVEQVVIMSPDKDLMQCVDGDRVVTFRRKEKIRFDEAGVVEKMGVGPESIPDYLALVGDTADGVPGLPGWGAKSTAMVLSEYHHLRAIPDDVETWTVKPRGAAKLAETLATSRPEAELYRTLTTLRRDVPLAESLDDLRWRGIDRPAFEAFCTRLGFDRLLARDLPTNS